MASPEDKHEACRHRVCVICYRKGQRPLSDIDITAVQEFVIANYNVKNPDFPAALCNGCHLLLCKKRNGHNIKLPDMIEDYDPKRPIQLRSMLACPCRICETATLRNSEAVKLKKKRGRPSSDAESTSLKRISRIKICGNCYMKLYPGCNHSADMCKSKRQKVYNLESLIDTSVTKQRLAARTIKESGSSLATLGSKDRPVFGAPSSSKSISVDSLLTIQQDLNLSTRQTLQISGDIRLAAGTRKIVESGLKKRITERNHHLENFFDKVLTKFIKKEGQAVTDEIIQWAIKCKSVNEFVDQILETRQISEESAMIRIGIDGGGGFLKMCLSVFSNTDDQTVLHRQSHDGVPSKRFKDSGVKKVFILGIVPSVQENYENVHLLWSSIGLDTVEKHFTVATDLKLANILLGLMAHGSMHPCSWCTIDKNHLQDIGEQRTFGMLKESFLHYSEAGQIRKNAKKFQNVVHPSIIQGADDCPVITRVPPPELHLLTGPVNTLYNGMTKIWPDCDQWLMSCNVQREALHGGSFTGNSSRKLLKSVDTLETICPLSCIPYVDAFRAFDSVVKATYGTYLQSDFEEKITVFKEKYMALNINVTPKVHAVFHHIAEFCQIKQMGLAHWSEQTSESLHHDFAEAWKNYKITDTAHPDYGNQLLKAVVMYNSSHL